MNLLAEVEISHSFTYLWLAWQQQHPPDGVSTDITLSQYMSIQEKGIQAYEFEFQLESNSFVAGRTEIQFYHGESCVQTNLPLPKNQEVYYWEAKMFEKPETTAVSVGVATKPYPNWRLPGLFRIFSFTLRGRKDQRRDKWIGIEGKRAQMRCVGQMFICHWDFTPCH
jgi:hypothetical protein